MSAIVNISKMTQLSLSNAIHVFIIGNINFVEMRGSGQFTAVFKLGIFILLVILVSCSQVPESSNRPNILGIYLEDTSPLLCCYSDSSISTPQIDKLA